MRNKIIACIGFVACFGIGFVCGMYAQSRIINGQNNVARHDIIEMIDDADSVPQIPSVIKCLDGTLPDNHGCCTGEVYTNMGDLGFNCCPSSGGDCFPPIPVGK